eukprot:1439376-Pleurochrysis_carterae.AAC.5
MHSLQNWTGVACVVAQRLRSAPQALGYRAHDGCRCPVSQLSGATAQARPNPRARECSGRSRTESEK